MIAKDEGSGIDVVSADVRICEINEESRGITDNLPGLCSLLGVEAKT